MVCLGSIAEHAVNISIEQSIGIKEVFIYLTCR
jgi:hypothetical protein